MINLENKSPFGTKAKDKRFWAEWERVCKSINQKYQNAGGYVRTPEKEKKC